MSTSEELWLKRARCLQTEEEWRSWEFATPLIRLITPDLASDRKLRLFTAACVRCIWGSPHLAGQEWVIEALERQADSPSDQTETRAIAAALREVRLQCTAVMGGMYWQMSVDYKDEPETDPQRIAWSTGEAMVIAAGWRACVLAGHPEVRPEHEHWATEEQAMCNMLRCVFGSPFRRAVLDSQWRTSTVVALARGIYEDQAFDRMPILADALEDAGCDNQDILEHCRSSRPHVRGCWVCDLVLGKS
jgi:hypothetical protein